MYIYDKFDAAPLFLGVHKFRKHIWNADKKLLLQNGLYISDSSTKNGEKNGKWISNYDLGLKIP